MEHPTRRMQYLPPRFVNFVSEVLEHANLQDRIDPLSGLLKSVARPGFSAFIPGVRIRWSSKDAGRRQRQHNNRCPDLPTTPQYLEQFRIISNLQEKCGCRFQALSFTSNVHETNTHRRQIIVSTKIRTRCKINY